MFRGSIPALITPFADGAVDEKALVDAGGTGTSPRAATGSSPVGTTGESPTLSHEEHEHVHRGGGARPPPAASR